MEADDIAVTREEQFATYRQTITPNGHGTPEEILTALMAVYRANRVTGPVTINFNQGGVRNIVADQLAKVREGTPISDDLEKLFGR